VLPRPEAVVDRWYSEKRFLAAFGDSWKRNIIAHARYLREDKPCPHA
jgi:hypothetical protein